MTRRLVTAWVIVCAAATSAFGNVETRIEQMFIASDLGNAVAGVCVVDLQTGQTLAEIDADEPMIPASNMKLLTTAAALQLLGPDFVFKTDLVLIEPDQPGMGGELPELVIVGDGDPAFGDPVLLEAHGLDFEALITHWVDAIEATGHTRFARLVVDDRVFDRQMIHEEWPADQLRNHYCAQVAGINFCRNTLDVQLIPASVPGQTGVVQLYPSMPFLEIENQLVTDATHSPRLDRILGTNRLRAYGRVAYRATSPYRITFHDPPMLLGELLTSRLLQRGISVDEVVRPNAEDALPEGVVLHRVQTALPLVLQRVNRNSQNMFAEALMKRMGRAVTGSPGSWGNGAAAMRRFLTQTLGARAAVVEIADGSGLSRGNRVTARLLNELLGVMYRDEDAWPVYLSSLAFAGEDAAGQRIGAGTLDGRFRGLPGGAFVYGKSGYINSVSTLSGYLVLPAETPGGDLRVFTFSILVNGFGGVASNAEVKDLQDRIVQTIAESILDPESVGR